MKINNQGKIAFHSIRFREDGGTDLVQFDYDGSIESITHITRCQNRTHESSECA